MTPTVHLLKFYNENLDLFHQIKDHKLVEVILHKGNRYHQYLEEVVNYYNTERNIAPETEFYYGLSLPRLKILTALVAQMDHVENVSPIVFGKLKVSVNIQLYLVPQRFRDKFVKLLIPGFELLGTVIKDSLSKDPNINCGNPFGFITGDLGFWWAGVVVMDWAKYEHKKKSRIYKSYSTCKEFYYDCCNLEVKWQHTQQIALSTLSLIPEHLLLDSKDKNNFKFAIDKIGLDIVKLFHKIMVLN